MINLGHLLGMIHICPNLKIRDKYNLLPGHEENSDTIVDPYESSSAQEAGAAPCRQFTITITLPGAALLLPVSLTAPASIQPVMVLN